MLTIYSVLRSDSYTAAVVLDTEDTDNYVQAAYVAQKTTGILCVKRQRQLIDARCLCSEAMAASIIPLHVLTGCDHNSSFYGASKKLIADRLDKSKEAQGLLAACGTQLLVTEQVISDLERFVIRYVYGDTKSKTLAESRTAKWRAQKKKKHCPTCARLGQSPSTLGACKLSCIFANTLPAPKSPLTDRPWMASCKWPMSACPFNTAPTSPIHTNTYKSAGREQQ